jgi:THO complex subunit 2
MLEKTDKKERSGKAKEKREKLSDEEKELRKERKLGRKRQDRTEEALQVEMKRRREEEKAAKLSHQNGEIMEPVHQREKHHRSRVTDRFLCRVLY